MQADTKARAGKRGSRLATQLRREGDVPGLLGLLTSENRFARIGAARDLTKLRVVDAVEPLARCLGDRDDLVRLSFVNALGRLGESSAAQPLFQTGLNDHNFEIRCAAAEGLFLLDARDKAVELLKQLLEDDNRQPQPSRNATRGAFRKWAVGRLVALDGVAAIPALESAARDAGPLQRRSLVRAITALKQVDGR
jgi:HEAT repeat protein